MKDYHTKTLNLGNSRGGVLVLVALLLFVFIGIAAFAIDIGYINTTKNELQNVADAAALAGAGKLGKIYLDHGVFSGDGVIGVDEVTAIKLDTNTVGMNNNASGLPISVDGNIQVGTWEANTFSPISDSDFTTIPLPWPNAVKVTAKRVEGTNGVINSLFAGIFGTDSFGVTADAVAALTGQSEFKPGELKLPIAVSALQFPDACQNPLVFNSNDDCTAWHMFDPDDNINARDLGEVLLGSIVAHEEGQSWLEGNGFTINKIPDEFISSGVITGDTRFNLTEGGDSSMFTSNANMPIPPMDALFEFYRERDDDGNNAIWTTTIPIYQEKDPTSQTCQPTSASQSYMMVGAADIIVHQVNDPGNQDGEPNNSLIVEITCSYKPIRGGGGGGGNFGAIPNLVE